MWRTTRIDNNVYRWRTAHSWQNGTSPEDIEVDVVACHYGPAGLVRIVDLSMGMRAKVALLIAARVREELDEYRQEEARHEAMVDAYEAAMLEGGA